MPPRIVISTSAAARLGAARAFLKRHPPGAEVLLVGASRGAADDLAREIAREAGAVFGLTRFSLTQMAARAAASAVAGGRRAPGSRAAGEAIAARAAFDACAARELQYFSPVAAMPGFPKALARTVYELRLAAVAPSRLGSRPPDAAAQQDLARLLARVETELDRAAVNDRAALFTLAADACRSGAIPWAGAPAILLDVPLDSPVEQDFVNALAATTAELLITVAEGDEQTLAAVRAIESVGTAEMLADDAPASSDLSQLRRHVFTLDPLPPRVPAGDVQLFSAPGEGREAVEIVRRALDEASRGVPFDQMAIFLRSPEQYVGLLEHACARGGVPAYFDRGTQRPDPAGRAFIALLSCAVEGLSAKRFDEYLSLGQVPRVSGGSSAGQSPTPAARIVLARDEVFVDQPSLDGLTAAPDSSEAVEGAGAPGFAGDDGPDSDEDAVVAGTLRSPWKWEELIVESAVVGGRTRGEGKARWRRRLDGLAAEYRLRIAELESEEPESTRAARYRRDLRNLAHLRDFALPIIHELADWPDRALWGEWLERFSRIATRTLRAPARVLQTLADLRPMASVGPVSVEEARDVLHDRLATLDWDPPARRYGRVFVGTPHQARGRSFRVVFVPGLAERIVPQRPREDPLLLDDRRKAVDASLAVQSERIGAERLLLKLAIGAASERVYLSYPRLDVGEARARVPSFYALEVVRAITGRVPDHRLLASEAADAAGAMLAWPAPRDPDQAIDDLEHDLASLKPLLESRDPASVKGHGHYLLQLNDALRRSVISQWCRAKPSWSASDGIVDASAGAGAALSAHRLGARPYSLSALQRYASCPYQFLLATVHRLEPWEEPEPVVRMDPLTRGSLFHRAQAEFYRAMAARGLARFSSANVAEAAATLHEVLDRVAAEYAEQLAPAIDRVWRDEIDELRRDLVIWVQKLADGTPWEPRYFEFSFGLNDEGRDPRSLPDPIVLDGGFVLRGSVDLIEHRPDQDLLRVTDHKTGRNRSNPDLIIGGGTVLQPVLYSLAVERALGKKVAAGRLYYCTTAGGFVDHAVPIDDYSRAQGMQALAIVDRAIAQPFLAAAPAERACTWCDFRPVCGPREEERVRHKAAIRLADLNALRSMR